MNYNWNWGIFFQTSPDGVHTYLETLLLGTGWTLATALSAWCLALAMGSLVGVIRTTPNPWLVGLGNAYVELFRNVPLLVQMFLWYFVIPEFIPPLKRWVVAADPAHAQFLFATDQGERVMREILRFLSER